MRPCHLLLGPSAFCLLAGALGLGISCLFLDSSSADNASMGRIGVVAAALLLVYGGVSLLAALGLASGSDRPWLLSSFFRWLVVAAIMVIPTALLFGPTAGFHHHIGFGPFPFFYMVWNGEDPSQGSFQIVEGYEVWFSPARCGVVLVVWVVIFVVATYLVRPTR